MSSKKKKMNVAILTYPDVEMVDMNGPLDTFVKANRYTDSFYNVYTVAETSDAIKSELGVVTITPSYSINNCPNPDIVVIPGAVDAEGSHELGSPALVNWIKKQGENKSTVIMSVCIGAYILAQTGLLDGKKATTHYMALEDMQKEYPKTTFIKNVRFVEDGNIVTAGGITSGIDGALHLIEKFNGPAIAQHVADIMVYNRDAPLPPYTLLPPY